MMNMTMSLPKMKLSSLQPHLHLSSSRLLAPAAKAVSPSSSISTRTPCRRVQCQASTRRRRSTVERSTRTNLEKTQPLGLEKKQLRQALVTGVSVGLMMALVMGIDGEKAMALGPEGPLMEEFWDNVRRYGLYALTVSTGALSAVFEPIFELLKNPISAVLIVIILGGSFYIVSQVVSAMVGVNEFAYDYGY
ncbi:Uncharacterized protein Rs2_14021 [Raphanus sativus]|uniref:Uncharacterized protein ycf33 n=1 Tax=Raphanus sativus TaxID=3726 RepID=A0A6J0N112_RAPSA|nr:uncharacterized protein LOC108848733 [Raphanus sativus]KAJ4900070.1 Uncharacterized protein Rs2_14021 [Raphanus sativus]